MNSNFHINRILKSALVAGWLFVTSTVCFTAQIPAESDKAVEGTLLIRLYEKHIPIYEAYEGFEQTQLVKSTGTKLNENKIISQSVATLQKHLFFYKKPTQEVLEYKKNGEEAPTSDYKAQSLDPFLPVLDKNGGKNYILTILEKTKFQNIPCYKIQIKPIENKKEYFKGFMLVDPQTAEIKYLEGTLGELGFPVKALDLKLTISYINQVPVTTFEDNRLVLDIPFILPNFEINYTVESKNSKPIPKQL